MKAFIISAIEWLVLQTDNDLDDKILVKVKSGMKLGVVWPLVEQGSIFLITFTLRLKNLFSCYWVTSNDDWTIFGVVVTQPRSDW